MLHAPNIVGEGVEPSPLRLRALSLGAGVQSTTLALMVCREPIISTGEPCFQRFPAESGTKRLN